MDGREEIGRVKRRSHQRIWVGFWGYTQTTLRPNSNDLITEEGKLIYDGAKGN
jgi:hypothetical protein